MNAEKAAERRHKENLNAFVQVQASHKSLREKELREFQSVAEQCL